MANYSAYNFDTESSSSLFSEWMAVPEYNGQASTNLDDGLANTLSSSHDGSANTSSASFDYYSRPFLFSPQPNEAAGCQTLLNSAQPLSPAFFGDASSTMLTHSLLPTTDDAFANRPGPSKFPEMEIPLPGDEQIDYPPASSHYNPHGELTVCFACGSAIKMPPPGPTPLAMGYVAPVKVHDDIRAGNPLVQHTVGAAGASSSGLMTGVDVNVGPPAFTSTNQDPVQFRPQGPSLVGENASSVSCSITGCTASKCAVLSLAV